MPLGVGGGAGRQPRGCGWRVARGRGRPKRGGFPTKDKAEEAAEKLYKEASAGGDVLSNATMADYLRRWIEAKKSLARTTRHGYQEHIEHYLLLHLGHTKCRDLRVRHLHRMYDASRKETAERVLHRLRIGELTQARDAAHTAWVRAAGKKEERRRTRRSYLDADKALRDGRQGLRKVTSPATMHRINETLSSAITWGMKREEAFSKNWAQRVELPAVTRPSHSCGPLSASSTGSGPARSPAPSWSGHPSKPAPSWTSSGTTGCTPCSTPSSSSAPGAARCAPCRGRKSASPLCGPGYRPRSSRSPTGCTAKPPRPTASAPST